METLRRLNINEYPWHVKRIASVISAEGYMAFVDNNEIGAATHSGKRVCLVMRLYKQASGPFLSVAIYRLSRYYNAEQADIDLADKLFSAINAMADMKAEIIRTDNSDSFYKGTGKAEIMNCSATANMGVPFSKPNTFTTASGGVYTVPEINFETGDKPKEKRKMTDMRLKDIGEIKIVDLLKYVGLAAVALKAYQKKDLISTLVAIFSALGNEDNLGAILKAVKK